LEKTSRQKSLSKKKDKLGVKESASSDCGIRQFVRTGTDRNPPNLRRKGVDKRETQAAAGGAAGCSRKINPNWTLLSRLYPNSKLSKKEKVSVEKAGNKSGRFRSVRGAAQMRRGKKKGAQTGYRSTPAFKKPHMVGSPTFGAYARINT